MKLVDSSVISEPVEFIFNLLNVVVTKHFLFSLMKLKFIQSTLYNAFIYGCCHLLSSVLTLCLLSNNHCVFYNGYDLIDIPK